MGIPLHNLSECQHKLINTAAGGTASIVSAVAGQTARIYRFILNAGGTVTVTFQDTASNNLSVPFSLVAGSFVVVDIPINGDPWYQSGAGLGLQLLISAAVQVSADIYYLQTP